MKRYQINFLVKAIISVDVKAENLEDAQNKAKAFLNKSRTFAKGIDYLDGTETICGYDDSDMWDEISS